MTSFDDDNEAVFCPATLKLGEMHWYILRASHLMNDKTIVKIKEGEAGGLSTFRQEYTDFGKEVGRDEINWWIFKKESDIEELRKQTTRALEAAQKLKETSRLLRGKKPTKYPELLKMLNQFAEAQEQEIDTLHQYVLWLKSRDPLAPAILCTYRVWGSTRMADRTVEIDATESEPKKDTVKYLTEIILGLVNNLGTPILFKARYEIGSEIWESRAYDEEGGSSEIQVPFDRVIRLASHLAFEEFAEYCELIRDSLRNILLDVDKFTEQRDLVNDDAFWQSFIKKAIQTAKTENLLWDFKETLTMWHTGAKPETEKARVTFAEDVASFANAQGGVLIVGVTNKKEIVGIGDGREIENKLKFASDVVSK